MISVTEGACVSKPSDLVQGTLDLLDLVLPRLVSKLNRAEMFNENRGFLLVPTINYISSELSHIIKTSAAAYHPTFMSIAYWEILLRLSVGELKWANGSSKCFQRANSALIAAQQEGCRAELCSRVQERFWDKISLRQKSSMDVKT